MYWKQLLLYSLLLVGCNSIKVESNLTADNLQASLRLVKSKRTFILDYGIQDYQPWKYNLLWPDKNQPEYGITSKRLPSSDNYNEDVFSVNETNHTSFGFFNFFENRVTAIQIFHPTEIPEAEKAIGFLMDRKGYQILKSSIENGIDYLIKQDSLDGDYLTCQIIKEKGKIRSLNFMKYEK